MSTYRAAVVGLGRIGMGFDYACADDSVLVTHASAFHYHPSYALVGGVDPDALLRAQFTAKYHVPAFETVEQLMAQARPDVVSIASPTEHHLATFNDLVLYNPKAIICEKPLSYRLAEAEDMVAQASAHGIVLAVNYMRRNEPGVQRVRELLAEGKLGEVYKGTVWYSKGLTNNGSHFIDLLRFWLGDANKVQIIDAGRKWNGVDWEPDVAIRFGVADCVLMAARDECFSFYEIDLFGTKGRLRYLAGGGRIELWPTVADPIYAGYTKLAAEPEIIPNDLNRYQWYVVQQLAERLDGRSAVLNSDGNTALETLKTVHWIESEIGERSIV